MGAEVRKVNAPLVPGPVLDGEVRLALRVTAYPAEGDVWLAEGAGAGAEEGETWFPSGVFEGLGAL